MTESIDFPTFVRVAADFGPMTWQSRLACGKDADLNRPETLRKGAECRSLLIDVPTGCGKTAGAVLAWLWNRVVLETEGWPRRLVYCLPMRTLVEQTETNARFWLLRLGLAATRDDTPERAKVDALVGELPGDASNKLRVAFKNGASLAIEGSLPDRLSASSINALIWLAEHSPIVVMGGEELDDSRRTWDLHPEKPAILIGTQDMLVSRALNRGYGMSRYRWPMHFGLLNTDCLWVLDEVQLMSSSLTTSLQLQAWRERLTLRRRTCGQKTGKQAVPLPTHSWWMSATAAEHWFKKSIAMRVQVAALWEERINVNPEKDAQALFSNPKTVQRCAITLPPVAGEADDTTLRVYAAAIATHLAESDNRKGKKASNDSDETENVLALVICNTVERAVAVYKALKNLKKNASAPLFDDDHLLLLHSRFRGHERRTWRDRLKAFEKGEGAQSGPRIIVATQVIEAGVDLSASVLYTELCPLASLIQRLGRCGRRAGQAGTAFWIDFEAFGSDVQEFSKEHVASARPYGPEEIAAARKALVAAEGQRVTRPESDSRSEPSHG